MVIVSDAMRSLMQLVERVARGVASVLIMGESGTGKELLARAIHQKSSRANRPFIELNCAALPEHLIESELFGYEKGAFSGADQSKPGMFELANNGTLFLDEIGEIDPRMQAKLLRVLDGSSYYRLGGKQKVTSDVRIIAATNRILNGNGGERFRLDLFYRLSQFQLLVPPLRERPTDILPIAEHYLSTLGMDCEMTQEVRQRIVDYAWPGNVRELKNVITQAVTIAEPGPICLEHLPPALQMTNPEDYKVIAAHTPKSPTDLEYLERRAIRDALHDTSGHQGRAAEHLGISRRTLSRKLRQYKIEAANGTHPLGKISAEQLHSFRAGFPAPVAVKNSSGEQVAKAVNISHGGIGVHNLSENPGSVVDLAVALPNGKTVRGKGAVIWSKGDGSAGLKFLDIEGESETDLTNWITEQAEQEGWSHK